MYSSELIIDEKFHQVINISDMHWNVHNFSTFTRVELSILTQYEMDKICMVDFDYEASIPGTLSVISPKTTNRKKFRYINHYILIDGDNDIEFEIMYDDGHKNELAIFIDKRLVKRYRENEFTGIKVQ